VLIALLTQPQYLRVLLKFLAARLELEHSTVLNTSAVRQSKVPLGAKDEVTITSLPKSSGAKLALEGGATSIALPSETTDKVISKSHVVKNRSHNARVPNLNSPGHGRLESLYKIM